MRRARLLKKPYLDRVYATSTWAEFVADEKRKYSTPKLREFGHVGQLTQAGSGQAAEGSGQQMGDITRRR